MPKYLTTFTYSSGSWARLISSPEDRTAAAQSVVEALGGTLECIYWQMDSEDGLVIADFPDLVTVSAVQTAIIKTGAFKSLDTHELLTQQQLSERLGWRGTPRRFTRYPVSQTEVRAAARFPSGQWTEPNHHSNASWTAGRLVAVSPR